MKRYCLQLALAVLIAVALSACADPEPTMFPPAQLPEMLTSLPRPAQIECHHDPDLDIRKIWLWSLPGRGAPDPDSGGSGFIGDQIGLVRNCESIQLIDFYWDPYEAEYWVKIESDDQIGWLAFKFIATE